MSQMEDLMQKCHELGKMIAQTDIFKDFKQTERDLFNDKEARRLVEDLQKMTNEQRGKQMAGIEVTKEEKDALKELEKTCIHNPQVLASNNANTKFQELMEEITANIKKGIQSVG